LRGLKREFKALKAWGQSERPPAAGRDA